MDKLFYAILLKSRDTPKFDNDLVHGLSQNLNTIFTDNEIIESTTKVTKIYTTFIKKVCMHKAILKTTRMIHKFF